MSVYLHVLEESGSTKKIVPGRRALEFLGTREQSSAEKRTRLSTMSAVPSRGVRTKCVAGLRVRGPCVYCNRRLWQGCTQGTRTMKGGRADSIRPGNEILSEHATHKNANNRVPFFFLGTPKREFRTQPVRCLQCLCLTSCF